MTYLEAVKLYGSATALARKLKLPLTTVHSWMYRGIPIARQYQVAVVSGNRLKVDEQPELDDA